MREEQERFFAEDRALPRSLKSHFSLPQMSRDQRAIRSLSASSMPNSHASWATPPGGNGRQSMNTLDDVVLGLPTLEDMVEEAHSGQ